VQHRAAANALQRSPAIGRRERPGDAPRLDREDLREGPRRDQQAHGSAGARDDRKAKLASRLPGRQQRHGAREQQRREQADHHLVVDLAELGVHVMRRHQRQQQPGHAAGEQREMAAADLAQRRHRGRAEQRRDPDDPALDCRRIASGCEQPGEARQQPIEERGPDGPRAEREAQVGVEVEPLRKAQDLIHDLPHVVELVPPAREAHAASDEDEAEVRDAHQEGRGEQPEGERDGIERAPVLAAQIHEALPKRGGRRYRRSIPRPSGPTIAADLLATAQGKKLG
jgi:hypothetical protein